MRDDAGLHGIGPQVTQGLGPESVEPPRLIPQVVQFPSVEGRRREIAQRCSSRPVGASVVATCVIGALLDAGLRGRTTRLGLGFVHGFRADEFRRSCREGKELAFGAWALDVRSVSHAESRFVLALFRIPELLQSVPAGGKTRADPIQMVSGPIPD